MHSTERISKCSATFNTVPHTALKEYPKVQLSSIQYHVQHWRNIETFSYLQYSTTYSNERISKCSVIFNRVPRTALKEYPNVQLPSIQYHIQHWRNIQRFSYLQYSTTYSTEGISKHSVIFNTVPRTALKEYPNVQLFSIRYHVQHWRNIQMFSYLQYSTMYSTEEISKCSIIFNTVPHTALKEYRNIQLSSIQYHVQHWRNIQMFNYLQYSTMYSTEGISKCSVIFNTVPRTALKEYPNV